MIITVTPNPALDLTYTMRTFEHGESQRVAAAATRAGGKGINVARVLNQVGSSVTALAAAGGETGRAFEADLVSSGIPHRLISSASPTRRSVALVDATRNETTVLNEEGNPFNLAEWQQLTGTLTPIISAAKCLTGSGSLPPGSPLTIYSDLVELAGLAGMPTVIDAAGPALLHAAEAGATVLKPNRRELAETTNEDDPVAGATHLLSRGATLVIVSLGQDGMIAISAEDPGTVWSARLARPLLGNPTGAGDAAVAAISVAIAEQIRDPQIIIRRAAAWGAAAVNMPQAGELAENYRELESQIIVDRY